MSQSIWTHCGASSSCGPLHVAAWRVVESQYVIATRKLVDSDDEQALLEELLDGVKPTAPTGGGFEGLHYLLSTPFRHPPLRNGSRFGTRVERGIFYGSLEQRTAFAEVAYYRLLFLEGTQAALAPLIVELSAFQAGVATERGVDLTQERFAAFSRQLESKVDYAATQALGRAMREDRVEAFLFRSARDLERGVNVGLFAPCFQQKQPRALSTWSCVVARDKVELKSKNILFRPERFVFPRTQFEVEGRLPSPAT